jgi:N-methylhydantoinase A
MPQLRQLVAADTGGTFTDVAVYDPATGGLGFGKTLTTYADLVDGVLTGLGETGAAPDGIALLRHGTTHIINAFLQRRGAKTALVTTEGFRDVLEIARGNRPVPFDLSFRRDPPLVPRPLRFEVAERIAADGQVIAPLDVTALQALVPALQGVEAIAISFLNAYANPAHEDQAAAFLRAALPGAYVTTGSSLSREWFEYERTSTAAANAFVGPKVAAYAAGFATRLGERGFTGTLAMMGSNGGAMPFPAAVQRPISLVESGPIGGVIAAADYARALGIPRMVAFDMGGTTAKCALVEDGGFEVQSTYWVGGYERGFPIRTPVLDIVEVGAGGGSIAWVDPQGRLRVGPRSAGSEPGPVAFGRGGTEPTVTDANLVLGRIGGANFLGGKLALDRDGAAAAIMARLATPLGYDNAEVVARGVLDLASTLMAGAIKEITVARGHDVRDFVLCAFGGGGPLFAGDLARSLGIPRVLIPPQPGNFSALGMLLAGARLDISRSVVADLSAAGIATLAEAVAAVRAEALSAAAAEFAGAPATLRAQAEMRYRGQRHTVLVELGETVEAPAIRSAFEAIYAKRYGRSLGDDFQPEIVALRIIAEAPTARPALAALAPIATAPPQPVAHRPLHTREGWVEAPVWRREHLPAGFAFTGPAIIEEYGATMLLGSGDAARVGTLGEISVEVAL